MADTAADPVVDLVADRACGPVDPACGSVPDEAHVQPLLRGQLGQEFEYHLQIDSTNRALYQRGLEGAFEGTVIVADSQGAGRGRLSRTWFSPPGVNLYLSVLLRPGFEASRASLLTLLAAVAARATFARHGLETGIKWPNDLLAGTPPRKISGILAEMHSTGAGKIDFVVLGIGFNLNLAPGDIPLELSGIAASYRSLTGQCVDRARFAADFLGELEARYRRYSAGDVESVLGPWRAGSATLGREVRVEQAGGEVRGVARDIDQGGALLVETAQGVRRITAGDIEII